MILDASASTVSGAGLSDAGLPRLDPQAIDTLNALYRSVPRLDLALGGRRFDLRLRHRIPRADRGAAHAFRLGTQQGILWLPDAALDALLDEPGAAVLPAELRSILLADALHATVERLRGALAGIGFEWLAPIDQPAHAPPADALAFDLTDGPHVIAAGHVWFENGAAWADLLPRLPRPVPPATRPPGAWPPALAALPLPLRLDVGRVVLSLRELRGITRGDIVAVEPWFQSGATLGVRVHVGRHDRPAFHADATGTRLTILSTDTQPAMTTSDPSHRSAAADAPDPPLDSLEALEVTLRFEAGQLQLPLGELAQVRPGHVFDLGQPLTQSLVRIVAHGSVVGRGQLVALGERLGVRVSEIAAGDV